MARDYRAMEEEFIADLKSRSGRDLAEWMAAIEAAGLTERDEIIVWLQPQGFTFEHASWLERIHNNDGRPIYRDQAADRRPEPRTTAAASGRPVPAASSPRPAASEDADALGVLLARGKAFRMLAEMLIGEATRALPGVRIAATGDLIVFERPGLLAAVAVTPRELRLGLALGERAHTAPLLRPKGLGADPAITHMVVLSDARQVDEALIELLRLADSCVNGRRADH